MGKTITSNFTMSPLFMYFDNYYLSTYYIESYVDILKRRAISNGSTYKF